MKKNSLNNRNNQAREGTSSKDLGLSFHSSSLPQNEVAYEYDDDDEKDDEEEDEGSVSLPLYRGPGKMVMVMMLVVVVGVVAVLVFFLPPFSNPIYGSVPVTSGHGQGLCFLRHVPQGKRCQETTAAALSTPSNNHHRYMLSGYQAPLAAAGPFHQPVGIFWSHPVVQTAACLWLFKAENPQTAKEFFVTRRDN